MPAPVADAMPTRKAVYGRWVAKVVAKMGAKVEIKISIGCSMSFVILLEWDSPA
jgi:hypothetical protein